LYNGLSSAVAVISCRALASSISGGDTLLDLQRRPTPSTSPMSVSPQLTRHQRSRRQRAVAHRRRPRGRRQRQRDRSSRAEASDCHPSGSRVIRRAARDWCISWQSARCIRRPVAAPG
jgi:hypothetical protein